jgi:hypothetical protein
MRRLGSPLIVGLLVALVIECLVIGWLLFGKRCEHISTVDADFFLLRAGPAVVVLKPPLMERLFGRDWRKLSIYSAVAFAANKDAADGWLHDIPMYGLGKLHPTVVFDRASWTAVPCYLYAAETKASITLDLDLPHGRIQIRDQSTRTRGQVLFEPDGSLRLHPGP